MKRPQFPDETPIEVLEKYLPANVWRALQKTYYGDFGELRREKSAVLKNWHGIGLKGARIIRLIVFATVPE